MKKKFKLCIVKFKSIFSNPAMFGGTFRSRSNLIYQKNNLWKVYETVFKLKTI